MKSEYTVQYYERISHGSRTSAAAVVPLVLELVKPSSVIDIGCGTGAWLAEFKRRCVTDVLGVDGTHVDRGQLEIDPREFLAADLTQPLEIDRRSDLAVCLEVAEHLPERCSSGFIASIAGLAPVILFSAAIPHQSGTHHVNEQWPAYWVERFKVHGYVAFDAIRPQLWECSDVDWWYRQNMILFVREAQIPQFPGIAARLEQRASGIPPYVHPSNYLSHIWNNRVLHVAVDIARLTGPGDMVIVVDEDRFGPLYLPDRIVCPFVERYGDYFGPPDNDAHAITELERMKNEGAAFVAIGWPAFWWLEHYQGFAAHISAQFPVVLRNEHVVIHRLRRAPQAPQAR